MKKQNLSTLILLLVFFVGLAVLLYPTVADLWNSRVQSRAIVSYNELVAQMSHVDYDAEFERADEYNRAIKDLSAPLRNYAEVEGYEDILNVAGTGIIGHISIPRISVELPIYHGTSTSVLNSAVGHLEGTSLPVGGESTHSVLSAHRGLPSAKLFTYLDKLAEGDIFVITVLDRELTYEVDQIRIVAPSEVSDLAIIDGADYVTLLTCTPYGINTHRLLVRGHRIDNIDDTRIIIRSEAYELDPTILAPVVAAPLLFVLLIVLLVRHRNPKKDRSNRGKKENNE